MKPKLAAAVEDLHATERSLADMFRRLAVRHAAEHDVFHLCNALAEQCEEHAA